MGQLFKNTGLLQLSLDTGISLTSAVNPKILYVKPDGTKGEWVATISGTSVQYNLSNTDINVAGTWQFQAYVEIGGKIGRGEIVTQTFQTPL